MIAPSLPVSILLLQALGSALFWYTAEEIKPRERGYLFIASGWCLPCLPPNKGIRAYSKPQEVDRGYGCMSYGLFGNPNLPNPRQVYLPIRLFQTQMAKVKGVPPVLLLVLWTLGSVG